MFLEISTWTKPNEHVCVILFWGEETQLLMKLGKAIFLVMCVCQSVQFTGGVPMWILPMMSLVSHRSHGTPHLEIPPLDLKILLASPSWTCSPTHPLPFSGHVQTFSLYSLDFCRQAASWQSTEMYSCFTYSHANQPYVFNLQHKTMKAWTFWN